MRIVLDAMGSDSAPGPELAAAAQAYSRWGEPLTLTGPRRLLENRADSSAFEVADAPEILEMT
ncbi:MAG TPA: hypothetical protein VI520_08055, partial [Anaerolineales bacterium]|nr:hypothetical protein [Anaerolineales bacterium]